MNRMLRLLKHRWHDEGDARRALDDAALKRLETRVRQSEAVHSGEIRLVVEPGLPWSYLWKGLSARDRAVTLFGKLRVWDTEHNNGVLIYLLLADRAIEIVADRGLNGQVPPDEWRHLAAQMKGDFQAGRFETGLLAAVDRVDALLRQHFPLAGGERSPNELPDQAVVIG